MAARADTKLTGSAGEHHVCSMLARYGWAASLTRDGLERTDVLAVHTTDRAMVEVQVKTVRDADSWPLGRKGTIAAIGDREWYVLVRLGEPPAAPESFVVPRDVVAATTWVAHMAWLNDPSVSAGKRNAGIEAARMSTDLWEAYRERWEAIRELPSILPVLVPMWLRDALERSDIGLPDGHPWHDRTRIPAWPGPTLPDSSP